MPLVDLLDRLLEAAAEQRKLRALAPLERKLEKAMARAFRLQLRALLSRLSKFSESVYLVEVLTDDEMEQAWLAAMALTFEDFQTALRNGHEAALALGAKAAATETGIAAAFSLDNPRAVAFLREKAANLVTGINQTTRDGLRRILVTAGDEGWSYTRTAREIRKTYDGFSGKMPQRHIRNRAELIAVTEIGESYEAGNMQYAQGIQDRGDQMEKSWLVIRDGHSEGLCEGNASAGWIPLDQAYPSGHQRPLGHPACRCTQLLRRAEAAAEAA